MAPPRLDDISVWTFGGGGDDILRGTANDDFLYGGDGVDQILGRDGNDKLVGGAGDDQLSGGAGDDDINGCAGADSITGDDGDDSLSGGSGEDTLSGGDGNDSIDGGEDDDNLSGDDGDDTLGGGPGDDALTGGAGNDAAYGGDGSDTINTGGQGGDSSNQSNNPPTGAGTDDDDPGDALPASISLSLDEPDDGFEGTGFTVIGQITPAGSYLLDGDWTAAYGTQRPIATQSDGSFVIDCMLTDDGDPLDGNGTPSDEYTIDVTVWLNGHTSISASDSTIVTIHNLDPVLTVWWDNGEVHGIADETHPAVVSPDIQTVTIDWGDSSDDTVLVGISPNAIFNGGGHTYANPADPHTVTVTTVDDDGGSDTQTVLATATIADVSDVIVSKSYIDTVTNLGTLPTPQATAKLAAFAASIFVNPFVWDGDVQTPAADGAYRLRAELDIHARLIDGEFLVFGVSGDSQGGEEFPGIYGTHNLKFSTTRISSTAYAINWTTWGRPNMSLEGGFQAVYLRTSVNIWHEGTALVEANSDNTITVTVQSFVASDFPSHKVWVASDLKSYIPQDKLSSLWRRDPVRGRFYVTADGTGPFFPF